MPIANFARSMQSMNATGTSTSCFVEVNRLKKNLGIYLRTKRSYLDVRSSALVESVEDKAWRATKRRSSSLASMNPYTICCFAKWTASIIASSMSSHVTFAFIAFEKKLWLGFKVNFGEADVIGFILGIIVLLVIEHAILPLMDLHKLTLEKSAARALPFLRYQWGENFRLIDIMIGIGHAAIVQQSGGKLPYLSLSFVWRRH